MAKQTSFTYPLDESQQETLHALLRDGNYRQTTVPHARIAVDADSCRVVLYNSGKAVIQGRGAEDFVLYTLEPLVLGGASLGYETVLRPESVAPHMGIDESGKGDFFGPIVISAAYVNPELAERLHDAGVKDSKNISSDKRALAIASEIRKILGHRFVIIPIGPAAYNRLYTKIRNVNKMLSWGHARAIENLLELVPDCPRALSDQFGNAAQLERALMEKGQKITLEQRPKAESDIAVAAASVLARAAFVTALQKLGSDLGVEIPKGASAQVRTRAEELVDARGPEVLLEACKCHFRTTDQVLAACGHTRNELGPEGAARSRTVQ